MAPVIVIAHIEVKVSSTLRMNASADFQVMVTKQRSRTLSQPGSAPKVKAMLEELKKHTHSKESHRHNLYDPVQDIENGKLECAMEFP